MSPSTPAPRPGPVRAPPMILRTLPAALLLAAAGCSRPGPAPSTDGMVLVPGGTFAMGARDEDRFARSWERPRHEVPVAAFWLDETEVTVDAFAAAGAAGAVEAPVARAATAWQADLVTWGRSDRGLHPVNGVSWDQADAYCRWLGRRLPTEAEFEYALGAGARDGIWPWGSTLPPPAGSGNYAGEETPPFFADGRRLEGYADEWIGTAPVRSFPPDPLGLHDLSGNTWEWCSDLWDPDALRRASTGGHPDPSDLRLLKGGGFHAVVEELRTAERHPKPRSDGSVFSGFRCAADASPGDGG